MLATWIEAAAKGRHGGQVRAGMWSSAVVGTHPIEDDQEVWLELTADDISIGPLPAYWVENKGVNSLWHVPIPPQAVNVRLHYRALARCRGETASGPFQDSVVRPNLPDRAEAFEPIPSGTEGLVGNRMMTARIDSRGTTQDIYFPTVGLHSDVRPAEGELPQSRSHFRGIVSGLAIGRRLDWFSERLAWGSFQHYQGATNLLMTELSWRHGPIRVLTTDFVAMGDCLPRTAGGTESPCQYIKRFRVVNDGAEPTACVFGVFVQAEVNGGIGEPGLSWHDQDRTLLAINRGHGHVNRKLARDATVEFALALDDRGEVNCEPTGPNEAILLRRLELPAGGTVSVDLLISGAFTGWRGDPGTFAHWLRPALNWFRSADLDAVEQATAQEWDSFIEPLPGLHFPKPTYAVSLRRSALALAIHADQQTGAIASGFDRGLSAYCWPREALEAGDAMDRAGHPDIGGKVFQWLASVKGQTRAYGYWFQKYTIDGQPEWETPAIDQTAMIPWSVERHYRRTGDLDFVAASWPIVERAAGVCVGTSSHPGLSWMEDLSLINSAGIWDSRFGAFLYSNSVAVAGLQASVRLAALLGRDEQAEPWGDRARRIWERGILTESATDGGAPGMVDHATGRFLEGRRISTLRGWYTDRPDRLIDRSPSTDISMLGVSVPFDLLPAADPRVRATAEAIFRQNAIAGDGNFFSRWSGDPGMPGRRGTPGDSHAHDLSTLATLWMVRYLVRLGRETGEGRIWNQALAILDALLARLAPLGLSVRSAPRGSDQTRSGVGTTTGSWRLHGMLIEAMLDIAGLDYDAPDRRLTLDPTLPGAWPHVGISQNFPCGEIAYRLERPIGGTVHRLTVQARLRHAVTLQIGVTCPGLGRLGPWHAEPELPPPGHDHVTGRLTWSVELPAGDSGWVWTWG
ncbi:glycosyl hydrolase [Tundrisphaera lichenicola]|uniref:glycosyl hydrolase n=1 Tax=Tundrisphaera lichenicola TaxID=2029860 RepID=UPI003EB6D482